MIVDAPPVIVKVPRRTADLLRILRRTYRGNAENHAISTDQVDRSSTTSSTFSELRRLALAGPAQALDAVTYTALAMLARITLSVAASRGWERDNGSRTD